MAQLIISVGREFGSGGRVIAEALAKRFDIPLYDRHLITEISEKTCGGSREIQRSAEGKDPIAQGKRLQQLDRGQHSRDAV